jgi:kynureninase
MEQLRAKSAALTALFIELVEATCASLGITFKFAHGYPVMQALIAGGVIGDFRPPDILRFGFAPLYTGFTDTCRAAEALHRILAGEGWREDRFQSRQKVT